MFINSYGKLYKKNQRVWVRDEPLSKRCLPFACGVSCQESSAVHPSRRPWEDDVSLADWMGVVRLRTQVWGGVRYVRDCNPKLLHTFTIFYYLLLFCVYRLLLPTCKHYPRKHLRLSIIPVPDIDLEDFGSALTVDGLLRLHTRVIRTRGFALDLWVQFPMYQSFLIPKKTQKKTPLLGRGHHQPPLAHPRHAVLCCEQPEVRHRPRCLLALLPSVLDAGFGDLLGAGTAGDPGGEWQVGDEGMVPIVLFVVG